MGISRWIDRSIAVVSPGWAARRLTQRLRIEALDTRRALAATFGAAERSRLTADWPTRNTSADGAIVADMDDLNARARAAVRDDWAAAAIVSGFRRHVVGVGISARAAAADPQTGTPFADFNRAADALWQEWCRARWCDVERRKSFYAFQSFLQSDKVTVGEAFAVVRRVARKGLPSVVLQAFEVEQLDRTIYQNPSNGNEIRKGIEIDRQGAAVAYWFYTDGHPLDTSGFIPSTMYKSTRVAAEDVCHLMRVERARQTHGHSRLSAILKKLRHLQCYDEYQLVAARMEACYGAAITSDPNVPLRVFGTPAATGDATTNDNGGELVDYEPAMILRLNPGEGISWHDPTRPGELYDPFVKAQVNQISTGAGLDYTTVVRDYTGGTYSGQRQAMIERDYEINPEQQDLIEHFCEPVYEAVIEDAILAGLLDAPGFETDVALRRAYLRAEWRPQAKPWIDPANQAGAAEVALRNKLTTRRAILNEQGEDWREVFAQLAAEEAELQRLNIGQPAEPPKQQQPVENPTTNGRALQWR